jgi:hypothetical protein
MTVGYSSHENRDGIMTAPLWLASADAPATVRFTVEAWE